MLNKDVCLIVSLDEKLVRWSNQTKLVHLD